MSLLIPIFVGGGEEGGGLLNFRGGAGVVKKRESPDFRSSEVGISSSALIVASPMLINLFHLAFWLVRAVFFFLQIVAVDIDTSRITVQLHLSKEVWEKECMLWWNIIALIAVNVPCVYSYYTHNTIKRVQSSTKFFNNLFTFGNCIVSNRWLMK